jgi:hypothetical protein
MRRDPAKAIVVLDAMLEFFDGGKRWTRGMLGDQYGQHRCLIGALNHIREQHQINDDGAEHYLRLAARTHFLMDYNDACRTFTALYYTIIEARQQAQAELDGDIPDETTQRRNAEAAEQRKRQLLAEIELENMARAARGDFRATYILCPEQPSHWQVEKMVEAHAVAPPTPTPDARSPASGSAPLEPLPAR